MNKTERDLIFLKETRMYFEMQLSYLSRESERLAKYIGNGTDDGIIIDFLYGNCTQEDLERYLASASPHSSIEKE